MFNIAIDGPAGAGKSSVAKAVSKRLNICYLDTGALYRAVGYFFLENNVNLEDKLEIEKEIGNCNLKLIYKGDEQQIFINEKRVDEFIRKNKISSIASFISKNIFVRTYLLDIQRKFARENNVVMDGRDIGTVVLKEADLKIFLTASLRVRAMRRFEELLTNGENLKFQDVLEEIEKRDFNDKNRSIAPLKMAKDAILIDTSDISLEESVERVVSLIKKHILEEQVESL